MEESIFSRFPTKEAFEQYWETTYVPVTYEDVKQIFEEYVKEVQGHIFDSDYESNGQISKSNFMENLSSDAAFAFQDGLTEKFYEKNPELYEAAFAIYEEASLSGEGDPQIAQIFHEEFQKIYQEFLIQMFEETIEGDR